MSPRSARPRRKMGVPQYERDTIDRFVDVHVNSPAPAGAKGVRGKLLPIAAGTAAVGGAGYLIHRSRQKKDTMSKNLVNPFEEVVVFGKAYPVALPVPGAKVIRALVPTGSHVGHGNDLKVVRNGKGKGGRRAGLEHYTAKTKGHRMGPFGKAAGGNSVANGLKMISELPKVTTVPKPPPTPGRVRIARGKAYRNSSAPDAGRVGRSL